MTPNKVVSAYRAIKEVSGMVFPYKTARAVASLKRKLQDEVDTIANTERALIEKHGGKANGLKIDFESHEKAVEFQAEYDGFMGQEAEIKLPAVDLSMHIDTLRLSPDNIEALDGIVIFEKEGTDNA